MNLVKKCVDIVIKIVQHVMVKLLLIVYHVSKISSFIITHVQNCALMDTSVMNSRCNAFNVIPTVLHVMDLLEIIVLVVMKVRTELVDHAYAKMVIMILDSELAHNALNIVLLVLKALLIVLRHFQLVTVQFYTRNATFKENLKLYVIVFLNMILMQKAFMFLQKER